MTNMEPIYIYIPGAKDHGLRCDFRSDIVGSIQI